jgi:hypothetical protein
MHYHRQVTADSRHRTWLTVAEAQALANNVHPIRHKPAPASGRPKVKRHWTDIAGATNPFARDKSNRADGHIIIANATKEALISE